MLTKILSILFVFSLLYPDAPEIELSADAPSEFNEDVPFPISFDLLDVTDPDVAFDESLFSINIIDNVENDHFTVVGDNIIFEEH